MSQPYLPPELLSLIADLLQDTDDALKTCCLVSKSWIPRTRRHLFAEVVFRTDKDLQSWKTTFPNPITSPAYYTRTLFINFCPVAIAGPEESGWILTFSRAVCFGIGGSSKPATDLLPFHGFSPVLKYLHLVFTTLPSPHVFNFICSFPLLEDLCLVTTGDVFDAGGGFGGGPVVVRSSSPPPFTGMLMLSLKMGMNPITSQLLSLPMGPHFRKLRFRWYSREDALPTTTLVEKCSPTLEFLRIDTSIPDGPSLHFVNLSKATSLESVTLMCPYSPHWAAATLRTITPNHRNLRQISLGYGNCHLRSNSIDPARFRALIRNTTYQEWMDLDHLLVQLCESHSIRLKVLYIGSTSITLKPRARRCIESLFPKVTASGVVDIADYTGLGWIEDP